MHGSLGIEGSAEAAGITSFANESAQCVTAIADYKTSSLVVAQPSLQDIKEYFARPRLVTRGALATASRARTASYQLGQGFLAAYFPQWYNRLSGVYSVRFTMNFRLQVAATAFHQGVLALAHQYGDTTTTYDRAFYANSATALPHTRLDLSENTMVELQVPFLTTVEALPVQAGASAYPLGTVSVTTILPIQAVTGLAAPNYDLYIYLTDVELYGADNYTYTTINLQSPDIVTKELKQTKLVSKTLDNLVALGRFAGRHVPLLSSITGPATWALDIASGVAKYFGFSKPMVQDPTVRMNKALYASEGHVDIPAAGFVVGSFQSNSLAVDETVTATSIDQMSLQFIYAQWSQVCVGSVSTTDTHSTTVYASLVSPMSLWFRAPAGPPYCNKGYPSNSASLISQSGNSFYPSSLMNIASYFRSWRGTVDYRITFAKTKFHGGRYLVSFDPYFAYSAPGSFLGTVSGPENTTYIQPSGYSMIMDLRDGNVFEFSCPYVLEVPYVNLFSGSGAITITCMDPLQSNASVTNTVPFLVEVRGGTDFDLADFAGPYFVYQPNGIVYQQSGDILRSATKDPCALTIGEKFTSVKQMIMVPSWLSFSSTVSVNWALPPYFNYYPSSVLNTSTTSPNTATIQIFGNTTCGSLSKLYAFARGSTDHHIYMTSGTRSALSAEASQPDYQVNGTITSTNNLFRSGNSSVPKIVTVNDAPLHIRSPAYQQVTRVLTGFFDLIGFSGKNFPALTTLAAARSHVDRVCLQNPNADPVEILQATSAGDDALLIQYLGPIPVYIPNSTNTNSLSTDWLGGF